jgi:hypothetical protein
MTKDMEISERNKQFFILKVLNFLSPRSFSFITLAKRERFINLFFRLLDSPDRNAKVL